jgi:hypothetical protein
MRNDPKRHECVVERVDDVDDERTTSRRREESDTGKSRARVRSVLLAHQIVAVRIDALAQIRSGSPLHVLTGPQLVSLSTSAACQRTGFGPRTGLPHSAHDTPRLLFADLEPWASKSMISAYTSPRRWKRRLVSALQDIGRLVP